MAIAIVKKIFDNYENQLGFKSGIYILLLIKFLLKIFNQIFHNWKVSSFLVVNFLLNFPNFKSIYFSILKTKLLLFWKNSNFFYINNIIYINRFKVRPYLMLKYYIY